MGEHAEEEHDDHAEKKHGGNAKVEHPARRRRAPRSTPGRGTVDEAMGGHTEKTSHSKDERTRRQPCESPPQPSTEGEGWSPGRRGASRAGVCWDAGVGGEWIACQRVAT